MPVNEHFSATRNAESGNSEKALISSIFQFSGDAMVNHSESSRLGHSSTKDKEVSVLIGAQWGDEGKGKWIDVLAKDVDFVVRYQGGNNAGHTLWIEGKKYVLHQIPSGLFHKKCIAALTAGVVVHPAGLVDEIKKLHGVVDIHPDRLWLSARAHVINPWTIWIDGQRESSGGSVKIGTTKRGIGPTYSEKAKRFGLRLGDYVVKDRLEKWKQHMTSIEPSFSESLKNHADAWSLFDASASFLAPFVRDVEPLLRKRLGGECSGLLEGAQGTLLDIDHGTYPFVTSSSTTSSGACSSIGMDPRRLTKIIGIAKAYTTRVGEGPFPTELFDEAGKTIATKGQEFGATTGRPRRCGWFDAVAMKHASSINGFDSIIVNKIDILTGLSEVKICVAYEHPSLGRLTEFPWDVEVLKKCQPVYESFAGWNEPCPTSGNRSQLPREAQKFLEGVERHSGIKILYVGTGPGREEFVH